MNTAPSKKRNGQAFFWRDSNLPFEARQAFDSTACYHEHTHPTFSIGIVDEGKSLLSVPGRQLEIEAGDVVLIWPGEVHACNPQLSSRWSYRMFYLDWDWVKSIVPPGDSLAVNTGTERLLHTPEAARAIDQMAALVILPVSPSEKIRRMRECLADLSRVAAQSEKDATKSPLPRESLAIRRARNYIEDHAPDSIDLGKLANDVGLTLFQFIRKFGREVGLTPHAYQLDQRVVQARELLKQRRAPIDIAYALGFCDQSHFQRVFKQRVAATPGQYRENISG